MKLKSLIIALLCLSQGLTRSALGQQNKMRRQQSTGNPFAAAQELDSNKNYLMALRLRIDTISRGAMSSRELARVGETSLAFNRFGGVAKLANSLRGRVAVGQMPPAFRAAVASAQFQSGRVKEAATWMPSLRSLSQITVGPARYRAHLLASGLLAARGQLAQAIDVLGQLMDGRDKQDLGLVRVQRARLFYDLKRYPEALDELVRVPKKSASWFAGMQVAVWASYNIRDYNLALGQLKSIHNPFLFGKFSPETFTVEAITLYRLCYFEAALQTIGRMREKYATLGPSINRFKRSFASSSQVADSVLAYARGQTASPDAFPKNHWDLIMDGILAAEPLSDLDATYTQADLEEDAIAKDSSLSRYRGELSEAKREAKSRMLPIIRAQIQSMERENKATLESALAIEVEVNTQIRERLIAGKAARRKEVDFETEIKKGYEFWPYEGEFWRDEIGGYAFATTDVCGDSRP